jgi:hypothetical protein
MLRHVVLVEALMMEAGNTSETSVYFYETTWCKIPEDSHLQGDSGWWKYTGSRINRSLYNIQHFSRRQERIIYIDKKDRN